jgi:general L-amino acid transport system ATP-binding protein
MTETQPMIVAEGVVKRFGSFTALRGIDLTVARQEVVVVIGPSGSGKSTLIRCINRLEEHDEGRIVVDGIELTRDLRHIQEVRRETGMVFQQFNLFPHLTVLDNVTLAPRQVRRMRKAAAEELGMELLTQVRIPEQARKYPGQLSGGQQQRVAIARALVRHAPVLLLDEPLSNLDAQLRETTRGELRELFTKLGVSVLYVTHDIGEALVISDRLMVLAAGRILEEGAPEEIYARPRSVVVAEFLGASQFAGVTRSSTERSIEVEWLFGRHPGVHPGPPRLRGGVGRRAGTRGQRHATRAGHR